MADKAGRVRTAVIGAGQMGTNHLRIYDQQKNVDLVGVFDSNADAARTAADQYGIEMFHSLDELATTVDAVSVTSPTFTHAEIGAFMLDHHVHCLIEKPLAVTEEQCLLLIETARRRGVHLMVGHVERFNPAVRQLAAIMEEGHKVHAIDVRRLSAVSARITDVDVVADLMVHDLDIVLSLIKSPVNEVIAKAVSTRNHGGDYVVALVSFEGGELASLTASRITQNKVRELSVTTDHAQIQMDYSTQTLNVIRQGDGAVKRMPGDLGNYKLDIAMERAEVRIGEPLVLELRHFIECIQRERCPLVGGQEALETLRLVWRIQRSYTQDLG